MHRKILLRSPCEWRCYQEEELLLLPYSQFSPPAHPSGSWAGSSSLPRRHRFLLPLLSPLQLSGEQQLDSGGCGAASARRKVMCGGCPLLGTAARRQPARAALPRSAPFVLAGGAVVSLVAFAPGSLAWLKATGTALSRVCLTLLTSSEPELSVRLF